MAQTLDIGSGSLDASAAPEFVSVYIPTDGTGTNVAVNSGDTITYYTSLNGAAAGTITSGNNHTFATAGVLYVTSAGLSNVTFTGAGY